MLNDFFEGNSVSMEVFETYNMYREEKSAKNALKQVYREFTNEYDGEIDLQTLVIMSVYYCGLKHGFCDEQLKEKLKLFSRNFINDVFGSDDGSVVFDALTELLTLEPIKQQKIKKPYNVGARKWNVGDVFAYSLAHLKDNEPDFQNLYALIHCTEIKTISNRQMDVKVYIRICHEEIIHESLETIFEKSFYLPSFLIRGFYLHKLISPHCDYPTDKLLHLGNITQFDLPKNEKPFPNENFCPLRVWEFFDRDIVREYQFFKSKTR